MTNTTTGANAAAADLALFTHRAAVLGVSVRRVATSTEAARVIAESEREAGAERSLIASDLTGAAPNLVSALNQAQTVWVHPGDPDTTNDQPFGVSLAQMAVAETASVLLAEATLEDRGIGLLVATQLVVCPFEALVPSLDEAGPALRALALRPGGAYATIVTGPSRTADIERVLTVGVQGPGKLAVLFVDDLS